MKKREHRLFIRVTDEERNCILDKMYGMGIHSLSAYIRKMALDGYCLNLDLPQLRRYGFSCYGCCIRNIKLQNLPDSSILPKQVSYLSDYSSAVA